ncbi:MAG: GlsB/YeaQ/YmgE family stress response membrane protein [Gemmatimonadales bacterium]
MTLDMLVIWIVVGGVAGLLADALIKGIKVGLVGAILVGILGAFIGGWLFTQLGVRVGAGLIPEIFKAFVGAALLLLVLRSMRRL